MRFTVHQYKALGDDITDADSRAQAAMLLRERMQDRGYALWTDPVPGDPEPVLLNADMSGWTPHDGPGDPDGHVIEWTAEGVPAVTDPDPLPGRLDGDAYVVDLPDDERLIPVHGGPVRIRHGLGGEVTVAVEGADGPMGYLFAQPVTDDVVHVELVGGARRVIVTRDEDER